MVSSTYTDSVSSPLVQLPVSRWRWVYMLPLKLAQVQAWRQDIQCYSWPGSPTRWATAISLGFTILRYVAGYPPYASALTIEMWEGRREILKENLCRFLANEPFLYFCDKTAVL